MLGVGINNKIIYDVQTFVISVQALSNGFWLKGADKRKISVSLYQPGFRIINLGIYQFSNFNNNNKC